MDYGQAAIGLILLLVVVGGLLYLFYSRTNAVEKTGYGSLIMLALVSLMIPVFWITEGGNHAKAEEKQYHTAIERGRALYGQICTDRCYAIVEDKVVNPTYNGFTMKDFEAKTDEEVKRIISAGVYNPEAIIQPTNPNAIPKSERYGGGLLSNDIDYLLALFRSTDPKTSEKKGFHVEDGFKELPEELKATNPTIYEAGISYGLNGQFGEPVDLTKQKEITIDIVDSGQNGVTCKSKEGCFSILNAKVKVGTKITWVNKSKLTHSATAINGDNLANPVVAPQIFDSAKGNASQLLKTNESYSYVVTKDAFNFDAQNHRVVYYCRIHPDMLAQLTIVE